ncbi:hypothetical protein TVAG_415060 [Trichomonas vaginalis G3]|uniref:Uncharacterized protein n=1 Tax=Trichomonas vaginalis (strain ATCC PRA-98 / G3) TaxID=412133 RepID=A2FAI9_TRIV3|nr:hypothetical protein TVAGG3_0480070 [Trichomonas vaginalis G3]EAX98082.1 hypothetical protein TVAG_415060 [Trichomonas vaginalis G3]KAI5515637.1 hypothetical protein TVAGG3_0480070 [Trichomonas vaginalis G3]|eukprot:XP_001311012.1 hypothetical protein [Trichomonas vaginalis G3]
MSENEASSLPKLNKKHSGKSPLSSAIISSGDVNATQLKREVNRLYPHLQSIEKEITALKQQLPPNLNKVVIQIRQDIDKLYNPNQNTKQEDQKDLLQRSLDDLENRLQTQLQVSIESSKANLENKVQELINTKPKDDITKMMENNGDETNYDMKLAALEAALDSQHEKTQKRLDLLEKSIDKLSKPADEANNYKTLQSLSEDIESNRKGISDLRTRLSEIKLQLDRSTFTEQIEKTTDQDSEPKSSARPIEVPDLTVPIENLNTKILNMQTKFQTKLRELKGKALQFEDRVKKVDQIAVQIVTSTVTLESRITEVNALCNSLMNQIKELGEKSENDDNKQLIQQLTEKVMKEQAALKTDIEKVKARALKCQESVQKIQK